MIRKEMENSKLGFGLMRLPKQKDRIDMRAVMELVDYYLDQGGRYFDTAYAYAGAEEAFRDAVARRYPRERYILADKMAGWKVNKTLSMEMMFEEQLRRCGVEYFDYYLLHSLQEMHLKDYNREQAWNFLERKKKEGRIRKAGFSYHADPVLLDQILTDHPEIDFVQLQINYLDWDSELVFSRKNYEVARQHGKKIIVMEPVKGGLLASLRPEVQNILTAAGLTDSPASYALRFAASLEGIEMVLSGMNSIEQLRDNLLTFNPFAPLTEDESGVLDQVREKLLAVNQIGCTGCGYCLAGCPRRIQIPEIFRCTNQLMALGEHKRPHKYYDVLIKGGRSNTASACIGCGQCEGICPQHLPVTKHLEEASTLLDH